MWYGGASSTDPDLTKIGLAYSPDGKTWTRLSSSDSPYSQEGLVLNLSNSNVYSDPAVVLTGNTYHMWFNSFSELEADNLVIQYASSDDGISWNLYTGNPVLKATQSWEYGSHIPTNCNDVVHPHIIWNSDKLLFNMWYGSFDSTGNETYSGIGYADNNNPVFTMDLTASGEEIGISTGPSVIYANGVYHMFYCGADSSARRVINHAVSGTL
jgi:hypothetical protein